MLIFLNNGRMHWLKVYDVPSMARQSRGRAIVNMLDIRGEESICAVVAVRKFDERFLVTATKKGQIKKTELAAYGNPRRGGIQATGVHDDDLVIDVAITSGKDEIMLGTVNGQAIRFNEGDVRPMGRTAAGVKGINLREGDEVVDMAIVDPMASVLTLCQHGYGKRTKFDEYRLQSRGGYGIINIKTTDRNGKVVGVKSVRDADELMLITSNGMIVRTGIEGIRNIGRATQGVRIMTLKDGDELVSIARVVTDESDQASLPLETDGAAPEPIDATEDEASSAEPTDDAPEAAEAPAASDVEASAASEVEVPVASDAEAGDAPKPKAPRHRATKPESTTESDEGDDDDVTML